MFGICILMWHSIFFKSVHNLGTNSLYVLLFRISILGQCVIPRQILKTGTEWEIPFQMDEHTFDRHLRITHSQFDYITYLLKQLSLNEEHTGGPSSIPLRQKLALFCGIWPIRIVFVKCQTNLTCHNHQPIDVLLKCSQIFATWCPLLSAGPPFVRRQPPLLLSTQSVACKE